MKAIWQFRSFVAVTAIIVGVFALSDLAAEFVRATPTESTAARRPSSDLLSQSERAASIAPFRSDLKSEYALAQAAQTLDSNGKNDVSEVDRQLKEALVLAPHDSRMWLALAMLEARAKAAPRLIAEALRMSYLTGQNRAELIPKRLLSVTSDNSLSDPELGELARGDVRAILTRLQDQRALLASTYASASVIGKAFLQDSVTAIDPTSLGLLNSMK
jgi:hypothetical protein